MHVANLKIKDCKLRLREEDPVSRTSGGGGQPGEKFSIESILGKVSRDDAEAAL